MKEPVEDRDHQVPVVTKVKMVHLAPRDLKDRQVQLAPLETRVILVLVEVKVPQVPRVLQDRLVVIRRVRKKPEVAWKRGLRALRPLRRLAVKTNGCRKKFQDLASKY